MKVLLNKEKFEELMARRNLKQKDLCPLLDTSEQYISMLKGNDVSPSPDFRDKMMKFFDVMFDDLFFIRNSSCGDNQQEGIIDASSVDHSK